VTADGERRPPHACSFLERYLPSYVREWQAVAEAVKAGRTPLVSTSDARAPLLIGPAALRSLREGRTVRLEEVVQPV
jgi:myo-inositol 2-dehydrogenase/D-chiro-inositol 1-dehydrogenase